MAVPLSYCQILSNMTIEKYPYTLLCLIICFMLLCLTLKQHQRMPNQQFQSYQHWIFFTPSLPWWEEIRKFSLGTFSGILHKSKCYLCTVTYLQLIQSLFPNNLQESSKRELLSLDEAVYVHFLQFYLIFLRFHQICGIMGLKDEVSSHFF